MKAWRYLAPGIVAAVLAVSAGHAAPTSETRAFECTDGFVFLLRESDNGGRIFLDGRSIHLERDGEHYYSEQVRLSRRENSAFDLQTADRGHEYCRATRGTVPDAAAPPG